MCFFLDYHEQVACHAVVLAGITLSAYGELHTFGHACGDFYFHYFFAVGDALARAVLALVLDNLAFAVTVGANALSLHHAEDALLGACHATCSVAIRTSFGARVAFCAASVAVFAGDVFLQLEFLFHTGGDVLEVELHLDAEI